MKWQVLPHEHGTRLQDFIYDKLKGRVSNKEIKRQIESNHCQVNGKMERFASKKIAAGDLINFDDSELGQKPVQVTFDPARILFEDDDLLIYNKPAQVTSDAALLKVLKPHGTYFLVHRLDKETTGAIILARTKEIEKQLIDAFRTQDVQKHYVALVDGTPKEMGGTIENRLGKVGGFEGQTLYGKVTSKDGLAAKTVWKLLKSSRNTSLIECSPKTGRTHQIRVHFSQMGHPLIGDYQYGKHFRSKLRPKRVMLHAKSVAFKHPGTGKVISVEAPLPDDFQEVIKILW